MKSKLQNNDLYQYIDRKGRPFLPFHFAPFLYQTMMVFERSTYRAQANSHSGILPLIMQALEDSKYLICIEPAPKTYPVVLDILSSAYSPKLCPHLRIHHIVSATTEPVMLITGFRSENLSELLKRFEKQLFNCKGFLLHAAGFLVVYCTVLLFQTSSSK